MVICMMNYEEEAQLQAKKIQSLEFFQKICSRSWVERVLLFGSRSKGFASERADIDLAVDCPKATEQEWLELLDIVENAYTLLPIDLVRYDRLSSSFKQEIMNHHLILYENKGSK